MHAILGRYGTPQIIMTNGADAIFLLAADFISYDKMSETKSPIPFEIKKNTIDTASV